MKEEDLELSITLETVDNTVEIPIDDSNAFQVRSDGVYLIGTLYLWEEIIAIMIVNRSLFKEKNFLPKTASEIMRDKIQLRRYDLEEGPDSKLFKEIEREKERLVKEKLRLEKLEINRRKKMEEKRQNR